MTIVLIGYFGGASLITADSLIHLVVGLAWFILAVGTMFLLDKAMFKNEQ